LDRLLVERGLLLARDERVADLPLDLVERIAAGNREVTLDGERLRRVSDRVPKLGLGGLGGLYGRHSCLPGLSVVEMREVDRRCTVGRYQCSRRDRPQRGLCAGDL